MSFSISHQLDFLRALIQCKSVTPEDDGAIDVVISKLSSFGFKCHKLKFSGDGEPEVTNLYAEYGTGSKNLCFAGHTDVVPTGDVSLWKFDPFAGTVEDGKFYGRGAVDMKGGISSFIYAIEKYISEHPDSTKYKLSVLISGNEEGNPVNGMMKLLPWLKEHNHKLDACIVGEPSNASAKTRLVKNGRRGSISFKLTVNGAQGHVAYPNQARNPVTDLVNILHKLKKDPIDTGSDRFQPSNLEVVTVDVGNKTLNVIPGQARAAFNIRFSNLHTYKSLTSFVRETIESVTNTYHLDVIESSEPFYNEHEFLNNLLVNAVKEVEGVKPTLSTSGGTSDARFIKNLCPVIEFGLASETAHKVDEHTTLQELENLTQVYYVVIKNFYN